MSREDWGKLKQFVKSLVSRFEVNQEKAHIAAIAFSTEAEVEFQLSDVQRKDEIVKSLDDVKQQGGDRYIDRALELTYRNVLTEPSGMRPNVAKVSVL